MWKVRKTTEQFIAEAKAVHGDKYDYSQTVYRTTQDKIAFVCPYHGVMQQLPNDHLRTSGCGICGKYHKDPPMTTQLFVENSKAVHGDFYDYTPTKFTSSNQKVEILCRTHGPFKQMPYAHIRGNGCPKCGDKSCAAKLTETLGDFIAKARKAHGSKYDYSKVVYVKGDEKVEIVCPEHGSFWQAPCDHKRRSGCPDCASRGFRPSTEALLYYLKVGPAFKIGITGRRVRDRYQLVRDQEQIIVLREWRMPGKDAQRIEKEIVERFAHLRYDGPQLLHAAFSNEMFSEDILDQILALYPQLVGTHTHEHTGWNDWPNKQRKK